MKLKKHILSIALNLCLIQAVEAQTIPVSDFNMALTKVENPILLDVRTPAEFQKGHLKKAININWNDTDFIRSINKFPKDSTVFVYCLSGGRSGAAAQKMRELGYKNVVEMQGGMLKWREANLEEETSTTTSGGMRLDEFNQLIGKENKVFVSFYADWCAPCKKMKPEIEAVEKELGSTIKIIRLNVDEHSSLCKELGVSSLPVLHYYSTGQLIKNSTGFLKKEEIIQLMH